MKGTKRLQEMADRAGRAYATIKAEAERRVVRWEWADFSRYSFHPGYFEINKFSRGKLIPQAPNPPTSATGYGFDANGRIVAEQDQTSWPDRLDETFYEHDPDGIRAYHYDHSPEKNWKSVEWFSIQNGRVVAVEKLSSTGNTAFDTYHYDEKGHMVRHERWSPDPSLSIYDHQNEVEYDAKGRITRVDRCYPDKTRVLWYQRATRKISLKTCKKELLSGLTTAIIDGLRKAAIKDEVYVLVVRYSEAAFEYTLPPCIGLNTVPERERLLKEHPDEHQYLWNPCEWLSDHCDMIYDLPPDLEALCAQVNQDIWQNERDLEVIDFLNELIAALLNADLPIRRSEDFLVAGLIVEQGDCDLQVKEGLPPVARKSFMKKGWLPKDRCAQKVAR